MKSNIDYQDSRRRFRRVLIQRKVLVRTCDAMGIVIGDFAELASTIDCSEGGMRIISSKEIPTDTLLLFNFDYDFLIPQLEGFAQLCWQRTLEKFPQCFEAGLLFKDDDSRNALAKEMEH